MAQCESSNNHEEHEYDVDAERSVLLSLCYRLLGSRADAEDAVQDTYVRWYRMDDAKREMVVSPRAWLMKVASRICFDMLGSARVRREQYVGEWLPEPTPSAARWSSVSNATAPGPSERMDAEESVSMALLVVMESMTPAERVAFVLHDVFDYSFGDVADVLTRRPEACRQLASSARRHLRQRDRHVPVDSSQHSAAVRAFQEAWQSGDVTALVRILDPKAIAITDGGGIVSASLDPLHGASAVARFFVGAHARQSDLEVSEAMVNGASGLVATGAGRVLAVVTFALSESGITRVWAVRNPEKLGAWSV